MAEPARRLHEKPMPYWLADARPARLTVRTPEQDAEGACRVETLLRKFEDRSAVVGVVGLGYVGLPFAVEKAKVGFRVVGIEQNPKRAARVNAGDNYIEDVVNAELTELVGRSRIRAVTDFTEVPQMDVVVIAVPTPLTINLTPALQYAENVTHELATHIRPGQLISLESTTYPGTTDEVMLPILERSGLKVEQDFFLAHSPERVDPGNKRFNTKNTNKVVGGGGPETQKVAVAFYSQAIDNMATASSGKAAEIGNWYEKTLPAGK